MKKLCTQCFHIGREQATEYGNFKTESILWGLAFFFALAGTLDTYLWLPSTIIFFAALFYTITRVRIKACVCPNCGNQSMIPYNSPKARQIMFDRGIQEHNFQTQSDDRSILGVSFRNVLVLLTVILVAVMYYKHFG